MANILSRRLLAEHKLGRKMTTDERGCFLKRRLTEDEAMEEAERLRRKGDHSVNAFRCDHCGEFHVGRAKKR